MHARGGKVDVGRKGRPLSRGLGSSCPVCKGGPGRKPHAGCNKDPHRPAPPREAGCFCFAPRHGYRLRRRSRWWAPPRGSHAGEQREGSSVGCGRPADSSAQEAPQALPTHPRAGPTGGRPGSCRGAVGSLHPAHAPQAFGDGCIKCLIDHFSNRTRYQIGVDQSRIRPGRPAGARRRLQWPLICRFRCRLSWWVTAGRAGQTPLAPRPQT